MKIFTVAVEVRVLRRDGFDGEVGMALVDAPGGFALSGARIPAGRDRIWVTLTAPRNPLPKPFSLHVESRSRIENRVVCHIAEPADESTQAFLWRHLVPARELLVRVDDRRGVPPPRKRIGTGPFCLVPGQPAELRMTKPKWLKTQDLAWQLHASQRGVTLEQTREEAGELIFVLKTDSDVVKPSAHDNLTIEVFRRWRRKDKGKKTKSGHASLGVLPAIPVEVAVR